MASDLGQPPQPPECQGYKCAPPHLICFLFFSAGFEHLFKGIVASQLPSSTYSLALGLLDSAEFAKLDSPLTPSFSTKKLGCRTRSRKIHKIPCRD